MHLYCAECWHWHPDRLGRLPDGRCCSCSGGRARARRVRETFDREARWQQEKRRLQDEAVEFARKMEEQR